MSARVTLLDALVSTLQHAADYNRLDQVAPAAVLWPDAAREWAPLVPVLREHVPILTLGPYAPAECTGPVAWLCCMVARAIPGAPAEDTTPVLYLPGIGVHQARDAARLPKRLEPLADLRYRGAVWARRDGRDWTVAAFLQDPEEGLGIEMRRDAKTKEAMLAALCPLARVPLERLREEAPWRASDFEALRASIVSLIAQGESATLEFKSTARWNVRGNRLDKQIEQEILKTVASFLNSSKGGTLLIGVEDNGSVCGLAQDYATLKPQPGQERDKFENWLMSTQLLRYLGKTFAPYIAVTFHEVEGRDICEVSVAPAPEPAFFTLTENGRDEEFFFVRTGNAKNRLLISDAVKYIRQRWDRT
jgi:hypothetical protein